MKFYTTALAASTALCLTMGMAYAGTGNTLYLDQSGSGNTADIDQSHDGAATSPKGDNNIGTAGNHGLQDGNNNLLTYSNAQYGGGANNDIKYLEQTGNDNEMGFQDWNGAYNNFTKSAVQTGARNYLSVQHNGGDDNTINSVGQDGNDNDTLILQNGQNGLIKNAQITGSGNGGNNANDMNWGIKIWQKSGMGNIVRDATITGNNNTNMAGHGYYDGDYTVRGRAITITQSGDGNDANATMWGSNGNAIVIDQTGVGVGGNSADVQQGVGLGSTGNLAELFQNGDSNDGTIHQNGSRNYIIANQLGSGNSLTAIFDGNDNGTAPMTGAAAGLINANLGGNLVAGQTYQDSGATLGGNSISYLVSGNNNQFAFAQIGGANTIKGSVGSGGHSNNNQAAVLQDGSGNNSTFSQTGGGNNNIAVSQ